MTYSNLKTLIENNDYERDDMLTKLDIFLKAGNITQENYDELVGMISE